MTNNIAKSMNLQTVESACCCMVQKAAYHFVMPINCSEFV